MLTMQTINTRNSSIYAVVWVMTVKFDAIRATQPQNIFISRCNVPEIYIIVKLRNTKMVRVYYYKEVPSYVLSPALELTDGRS